MEVASAIDEASGMLGVKLSSSFALAETFLCLYQLGMVKLQYMEF